MPLFVGNYMLCDSSFWSSTVSAKLLHCQVSARIPWRNLGSEPTVNCSDSDIERYIQNHQTMYGLIFKPQIWLNMG